MCQALGHGDKADPRARFLLAGDSAAVRETDKATEDVQRQGVTRAGRSRNKGQEEEDGSGHGSSRIRGCERRRACDYRGQDGAAPEG